MSNKRAKTSSSSKSNSRLEFAKAINGVTMKQEAFNKAVETLGEFTRDELIKIDLEIEAKKKEFQMLEEQVKNERKNRQIETDQLLKEYKYKGACQILEEQSEVPIKEIDLQNLRTMLGNLQKDRTAEVEKIKEDEQKRSKRAIDAAMSHAKLSHKAETAILTATVDQQKKEINSFEQTLLNLKEEIAAQRELTKQVAQAGRSAPITQSFGPK